MARRPKRDPRAGARADAPALEALELLEDRAPPHPVLAILVIAATLALTGYFVRQGIEEAGSGRTRLAGKLLEVAPRDQIPRSFSLSSLQGGQLALSDLRGKVVLLNFWATWCPPCIEEMPSMVQLFDKMKGDPRFAMVAISTDESWDPVQRFFANTKPGFTVLLDPNGQLAKEYGTTMFPETYVVIDGRVRGFIEGPRRWDTWYAEAYLRGLLDEG